LIIALEEPDITPATSKVPSAFTLPLVPFTMNLLLPILNCSCASKYLIPELFLSAPP
jgi:hypothetical protein